MKFNAKLACGIFGPLVTLATIFLFVPRAVGQNLGAICPGWSVTDDVRMAIDLNRDGKADLAAFDNADNFNHSALWTAINTGSGIFSVQKALPNLDAANAGDPTKHVRMLVDLNGDHVPDIVIFGDAGVWTSLSQQNPRVAPQLSPAGPGGGANPVEPPTVFSTPTLVLPNFGVQQGWDPQKHVRFVVDVNHDGYADIVGFGDAGVWVALGKGDGTFQTPNLVVPNFGANQGWSPAKHVRLLADLNHDGYPDIVAFGDQGVFTAMNNGDATGTFKPVQAGLQPQNFGSNQGWTVEKHVRMTAVLNSVGYADIIAFGDAGVWTALGNGDGTFQAPKLALANFGVNQGWDPAKHVRLMADLNHDGKDDIVAFGDAGVWTALSAGHGTFGSLRLAMPGSGPQGGTVPVSEPGAGTFEIPHLVLQNFGVDQEWSPAKHLRLLADLNDDHYPDIVGFGDGGVWTSLGNGDGTFQTAQFPLDYFACKGRFDFNVETAQTDPNGFPFNPLWRWQLYHPQSNPPNKNTDTPQAAMCHYFSATEVVNTQQTSIQVLVPSYSDCTDQTNRVNTPDGWNELWCGTNIPIINPRSGFDGHLNWFTATFGTAPGTPPPSGGSLSFGGHNGGDDDYDMSFYMSFNGVPAFPAMMNGRDSQHVEFDASETIKYYQSISWWRKLYNAVNNGSGSTLLYDTEAILTGLFGVDCEHDSCKSELHPVYTFAAHVQNNPNDDVWAMFLRNTGDEGYCSSNMTYAPFTNYTFHLPWRSGMTSVEVLWGANESEFEAKPGSIGPDVTYLVGQWVGVTFTLDVPSNRPRIDGELHLRWTPGTDSLRTSNSSSLSSIVSSPHAIQEEPDEADPLRSALDRLSPAQKNQIMKAVAAAIPSTVALHTLPAGQPAREVTASEAPAPHAVVRMGELGPVATEKAARDAALIRELCKAYGGSIEGAPANMCKK